MTERTCSLPGCQNRLKSRGWCSKHYERWRRGGNLAADTEDLRQARPVRFCTIDGCGQRHYSLGMCKPHYRADYHEKNRPREQATHRAWRIRNAAARRAHWRLWWVANRTQRNERRRVAYALSPEAYRAVSREWKRRNPGSHTRWRKANPERWALINRENQRRRRRVDGHPVDLRMVLHRDGMQCYLCGRGIAGLSQLHFDHVVPLSRGGTHAVDNIRPAHAACNLRKSHKLISELDWVVAV